MAHCRHIWSNNIQRIGGDHEHRLERCSRLDQNHPRIPSLVSHVAIDVFHRCKGWAETGRRWEDETTTKFVLNKDGSSLVAPVREFLKDSVVVFLGLFAAFQEQRYKWADLGVGVAGIVDMSSRLCIISIDYSLGERDDLPIRPSSGASVQDSGSRQRRNWRDCRPFSHP